MGKSSIRIQAKPTKEYPHQEFCHICNKKFYARYNFAGRARVCTPPNHKCKIGKKKSASGAEKKVSCMDNCCRSQYSKGASDRVSDITIDHRKFLNGSEYDKFVEETYNLEEKYGLPLRLILAVGLRAEEAFLLRPDHFHLNQEFPVVEVPTLKRGGRPLLPVDLNEEWIVPEIQKWLENCEPKQPIFQCTKRTIQRKFKQVIREIGLEGAKDGGVHILRHTRASRLVFVSNGDLNYVRKQLRWKSLETGKNYMHTSEKERKEISNRLKEMSKGKGKSKR